MIALIGLATLAVGFGFYIYSQEAPKVLDQRYTYHRSASSAAAEAISAIALLLGLLLVLVGVASWIF